MNLPLEKRALGAYWGLALGDALGATVEFMTPHEIRAAHGVHDSLSGGGWLRLKPGQVTDDTGMSLFLGQAILDHGTITPLVAAQAFDAWMRSRPVDIGNTVRRGILHFRRSGVAETPPDPQGEGNGACMRLLPAVLATLHRSEEDAVTAVLAQAHVTHHAPRSDAACVCVARMLRLAMAGAGVPDWIHGPYAELLADYPEFRFRIPPRGLENPSGYIVDTLKVVMQGVVDSDTLEEALVTVVNRGGDADTTGAIAGMLAGALHGAGAIPPRWLKVLDPAVRDACQHQALRLIA